MTSFPFYQVDAFTSYPLGGNPCAILFDTDALDETTMLAIAREMNLSETAFVRRSAIADFGVRYFTPAEEIPLAGHPTIATTFALVDSGRLKLSAGHTTIQLELKHGPIPVEIYRQGAQVQRIVMTQRKPQFLSIHDPAQVLPVFGLRHRRRPARRSNPDRQHRHPPADAPAALAGCPAPRPPGCGCL